MIQTGERVYGWIGDGEQGVLGRWKGGRKGEKCEGMKRKENKNMNSKFFFFINGARNENKSEGWCVKGFKS